MYAIGELLESRMAELGITKREVVQRLGFQNVNKGIRRLTACVQQGDGASPLLQHLASALEVDQQVVDEALRLTAQQVAEQRRQDAARREADERQHFQPYVYVQTALHRPAFITGVAAMGMGMKYLPVSEAIHTLPLDAQVPFVQDLIHQHYQEYDGECPLFGEITGYLYRWSVEASIAFAPDGTVTNRENGRFAEDGVATAAIGTQRIPFEKMRDEER